MEKQPGWLALLLGIGLALIQLLPTLELLKWSVRAGGVGLETAALWSFHPVQLLGTLVADVFGNLFKGTGFSPLLGERKYGQSFLFVSTYAGISVLLLATLAPLRRREPLALFWAGCALLTILLALGSHFALYPFLYRFLPGFQFFRYPTKFLIFTALALALLAGQGMESLAQGEKSWSRLRVVLGIWIALLSGSLLALTLGFEPLLQRLEPLAQTLAAGQLKTLQWATVALRHVQQQFGLTLLIACLTSAILVFHCRRRPQPFLLVLVVLVDLLASGVNSVWSIDRSFLRQPSAVAAQLASLDGILQPDTRLLQAWERDTIPTEFLNRFLDAHLLAGVVFYKQYMQGNASLLYRYHNAYGFWAARLNRIDTLYSLYKEALNRQEHQVRQTIETLLAVRYVLEPNQPSVLARLPQGYRQRGALPELGYTLWENRLWQPRAHFKHQAFVVKNEDLMVQGILYARDLGFDPRQHVLLLDDETYQAALRQIPPQASERKQWTAPVIEKASNNEVRVRFATDTSGYLVLADAFYPGWKAYDNGREVPILQANYLQRAVRVGSGSHEVVFRYLPLSLQLGLWGSAASALLVLLLGIAAARFRTR